MKLTASYIITAFGLFGSTAGATQLLTVPDGRDGLRLGTSAAIHSDVAVLGAYKGGWSNQPFAPGLVAVFRKNAQGVWSYSESIEPFDGESQDWFGWKVALTERWLAVICLNDDLPSQNGRGSVYVYEDLGDHFSFHSRLVPPPGGNQTNFNADSVALDGDRLVVGSGSYHLIDAQYIGPNSGAIHVYDFDGAVWQHSDSATDGRLGFPGGIGQAVQIHGDVIVAGNHGYRINGHETGLVVIFERSPSGLWEVIDRLDSPYPDENAQFSRGMSLDGDQLAVVANYGSAGYGSVRIYNRTPSRKWRLRAAAYPDVWVANMGRFVDLRGQRLLVGGDGLAPAIPSVHSGGVMHFTHCGGYWGLDGRLQIPSYFQGGNFEQSFAFDDDQMLVAYPELSTGGFSSVGGAYVVRLPDKNPITCDELGTPIALPSAAAPCPCGNDPVDPLEGCVNSTGRGARVWARGQLSIYSVACQFHMEGLPPNTLGLVANMRQLPDEAALPAVSGDGLLLRHPFVAPSFIHVFRANAQGEADWIPPAMEPIGIFPGTRGTFQVLYRDPGGPCGTGMNWAAGFVGQFVP
ncbi:hypothetical protein Poly30_52210 [Planctomycetes bacterium Poly30]|uniref:Cortical protein marker for cell polarity n=1 Tax=Saltatorellus ferox TaxID=2528018 RepID=A0A518F004_9BACT|nr:hypothetical protein Poly30_52210 [Planctomycetes bacterium Poly30]